MLSLAGNYFSIMWPENLSSQASIFTDFFELIDSVVLPDDYSETALEGLEGD